MLWFGVLVILGYCEAQRFGYDRNSSTIDYESMPALSELDDYDTCLKDPGGLYCIADLDLLPDDSPLFDFITNYSRAIYKHYDHSRLHRGVCVSRRSELRDVHLNQTLLIRETLLQITNYSIYQEHHLQVERLSVRYCKARNQPHPPDALDLTVAAILILIVCVNLTCSLYHLALMYKNEEPENPYILNFSLFHNWNLLRFGGSGKPGKSKGCELFKSLQGLRFYVMAMILGLHSLIFIGYGYTSNPDFFEEGYDHWLKAMLFNARVIVQVFFVMSGFLMAYKSFQYSENHKLGFGALPMAIVHRWLRFMPALLVVIGLAMTWVPRMGDGPMWDAVVTRESKMCRAGWWQMVFLVANYFPFDRLCLPQAWYLGTDMQLYVFGMVVVVLMCRYRRAAPWILGTTLVTSLLFPLLQTVLQDLLPIRTSLFPDWSVATATAHCALHRSIRNLFANNDTFYHAYVSAQGNLTGFALGMATAFIYHTAQTRKWNLQDSLALKVLFLASVPLAVLAAFLGWDLHEGGTHPVEVAVFNALDQNFFALAICIFMLGCFYKCDKIIRGAAEWSAIQPLGRLSFCAMLLHTTVLRTYGGQLRRTFFASDFTAIMLFAGVVTVTYLVSVPLHLLVEAPGCGLQKLLLMPRKKPRLEEPLPRPQDTKPAAQNGQFTHV